ncbi:radical SAM protein, partial [Deltaproteobacteria bacterium OttesenSCG-928-K17]|nr:radical SAM protein [Deltaproteobacteria bacterium OttesenSCG-928-K17]
MTPGKLIERTESLCPLCLKVLPADIVERGDEVFLSRSCPDHGLTEEVIWRGRPSFESWRRPKLPAVGLKVHRQKEKGCPHDCGLCPDHAQHPCTILFEITSRCNLRCPICFAGSGDLKPFTPLADLKEQLAFIRQEAGEVVLQLSGGEPTLHPGLIELTAEAARLFPGVQLNTNGLALAENQALADGLAQAGLSWVFLQFDGLCEKTYEIIRGRPLLEIKKAAIEACARAALPVVLVPTVAAGVNDGELGDIVRFAVSQAPTVRGVHLQPMTASGRNSLPGAAHRLTLPEVLTLLEKQTGGLIEAARAFPPSCEHERCSFHLRYRRTESGGLIPMAAGGSCCAKTTSEPIPGEEGAA